MFQEKFYEFCTLVFPDLYNIGSEIEKQTKNFFANFLIGYLSYYDEKFLMKEYEYTIDEIKLSSRDIREIRNIFKKINQLSKLLPLDDDNSPKYDNIIVRHIINDLFKGLYYKEKQFIASFTNAYLFKIGYYNDLQIIRAAGSDIEMVQNILLVFDGLDEILGDKVETVQSGKYEDFLREEIFV